MVYLKTICWVICIPNFVVYLSKVHFFKWLTSRHFSLFIWFSSFALITLSKKVVSQPFLHYATNCHYKNTFHILSRVYFCLCFFFPQDVFNVMFHVCINNCTSNYLSDPLLPQTFVYVIWFTLPFYFVTG